VVADLHILVADLHIRVVEDIHILVEADHTPLEQLEGPMLINTQDQMVMLSLLQETLEWDTVDTTMTVIIMKECLILITKVQFHSSFFAHASAVSFALSLAVVNSKEEDLIQRHLLKRLLSLKNTMTDLHQLIRLQVVVTHLLQPIHLQDNTLHLDNTLHQDNQVMEVIHLDNSSNRWSLLTIMAMALLIAMLLPNLECLRNILQDMANQECLHLILRNEISNFVNILKRLFKLNFSLFNFLQISKFKFIFAF